MIDNRADPLKPFDRLCSTLLTLFKWIWTDNFGRCCLFHKFLDRCLIVRARTSISLHIYQAGWGTQRSVIIKIRCLYLRCIYCKWCKWINWRRFDLFLLLFGFWNRIHARLIYQFFRSIGWCVWWRHFTIIFGVELECPRLVNLVCRLLLFLFLFLQHHYLLWQHLFHKHLWIKCMLIFIIYYILYAYCNVA